MNERATAAAAAGLHADLTSDSPVLVVAFAGLAEELGIPAFEFMRMVSALGTQTVFVRDTRRLWYQRGVPGLGPSVDTVADALADLVRSSKARRTVFLGSSAGGYAALLFSSLVPAHRVLAFGPQTVVDPAVRASLGDGRWLRSTQELERSGGPDKRYGDLAPIFHAFAGDRPEVLLHYADGSPLDVAHAERLGGAPKVSLRPHPVAEHNIPALLKREGRLAAVLEESLA